MFLDGFEGVWCLRLGPGHPTRFYSTTAVFCKVLASESGFGALVVFTRRALAVSSRRDGKRSRAKLGMGLERGDRKNINIIIKNNKTENVSQVSAHWRY